MAQAGGDSDRILGISDYNKVYETCKQFSSRWDDIGSSLGISKPTLNIIATNNQRCENRMSDMLDQWLRRETIEQPCPTWRKLCQVLCNIDRTAAKKIAKDHQFDLNKHTADIISQGGELYLRQRCGCGNCSIIYLMQGNECEKSLPSKYPKLLLLDPEYKISSEFDRNYDDNEQLLTETLILSEKYRQLATNTWLKLQDVVDEQQATIERIVLSVSARFDLQIRNVSDIQTLQQYYLVIGVSWLKFLPLYFLVEKFLSCTYPEISNEWSQYFDMFKQYCSGRNLKEYAGIFFNAKKENIFILDIDENYHNLKLSDIDSLRDSLSFILNCPSLSLHLVTVRSRSLHIYFCYVFDDYLVRFQLTQNQLKLLADITQCRILSLRDEGNRFVYNHIQTYKIIPPLGRQHEEPTEKVVWFGHKMCRTVTTIEILGLEVTKNQFQLLCPSTLLQDKEITELNDEVPEQQHTIEDTQESVTMKKEGELIRMTHVMEEKNKEIEELKILMKQSTEKAYQSETDMMILYKKTSLMKCQELLAKEKQIIELQNKNSSLQQTVNKGKILEEEVESLQELAIDKDSKMNELKIELEKAHEKIKNFKQLELKEAQPRFLQIPRKSYHLLFAEKELEDGSLHVDICIMYSIEVKNVIEQFKEYNISFHGPVSFSEDSNCMSVTFDPIRVPGWNIEFRGIQYGRITEDMIDFYQVLGCTPETMTDDDIETLKMYEELRAYPPRFKLLFSPDGSASVNVQVKLSICGLKDNIYKIIKLASYPTSSASYLTLDTSDYDSERFIMSLMDGPDSLPNTIDITKKSPEWEDVYHLLKNSPVSLDDLARELKLSDRFRDELSNDSKSSFESKLERSLKKWIQSQPSDVTWKKIIETLVALDINKTAQEVKKYLEQPDVYIKYSVKLDFNI